MTTNDPNEGESTKYETGSGKGILLFSLMFITGIAIVGLFIKFVAESWGKFM